MTRRRSAAVAVVGFLACASWFLLPAVPAAGARARTATAGLGLVTVTPNTGLIDGQTVTATGSGWVPGHYIAFCEAARSATPEPGDCFNILAGEAADGTGSFSVQWAIEDRGCANPPYCMVRYADASDLSLGEGALNIDFAPPGTTCPLLVAAAHTSFSLSDGYAVGSVATFVADADHLLVGSASLTCQPDLSWSGSPPTAVFTGTPVVLPSLASVVEGNSGTVSLLVPVSLSEATTNTVTVPWATASTASANPRVADPASDFTAASGTVTFAPGETAKAVSISVNSDVLVEPDEWIVVSFNHPTNAKMGGYYGLGFGIVTNDDHATVVPGGASVVEGSFGTVDLQIPVTLSNPSTSTITVQWSTLSLPDVPPRADVATDFTAASGAVTFAPGETAKTVTISVNGDVVVEPDEWIVVSFKNPTNAKMGGFYGLGFGVITNDDASA